jgi:gluconolactonase
MFARKFPALQTFGLLLTVALLFGAVAALPDRNSAAADAAPRIVRMDPQFDALVPRDAKFEKIVDGFDWVEGPVWNRKGGFLLFSEIPSNSVYKWQDGRVNLFLRPSGYTGKEPFTGPEPGSNGLAFDAEGRLVLCEHGDRRITRLESSGKKTVLADRFEGKRLNSPNDMVFKRNGDLYFTDPPFGLPKAVNDPAKELPFQGVYRLAKNGTLTLLTRDIPFPNGIAFSPDEKTLYVSNAELESAVWWAFPVKPDGTIGPGEVFFDGTSWLKPGNGVADGMKVDKYGNLFAAGPGGLYVFSPQGKLLGSFAATAGKISNCAWGGDGSDLFLTAGSGIYRIRLTTQGPGY